MVRCQFVVENLQVQLQIYNFGVNLLCILFSGDAIHDHKRTIHSLSILLDFIYLLIPFPFDMQIFKLTKLITNAREIPTPLLYIFLPNNHIYIVIIPLALYIGTDQIQDANVEEIYSTKILGQRGSKFKLSKW